MAREAAQLAADYMTEMTHGQPARITAVEADDQGNWIVEVEVVEDRRIPSSADMLALYEFELDLDGALLGYRRTRRYMRGQPLEPAPDEAVTAKRGQLMTPLSGRIWRLVRDEMQLAQKEFQESAKNAGAHTDRCRDGCGTSSEAQQPSSQPRRGPGAYPLM
jgi:hypothetical protein